jgi:hypothetical protein
MRPPLPVDPPPDVEDAVALLGLTGPRTRAVPRRRGLPLMVALGLALGIVGTVGAGATALVGGNALVPAAAIRVDADGACGRPWRLCRTAVEAGTGVPLPDDARIEAAGEDDGRTWLEPPGPARTWARLCVSDPDLFAAEARILGAAVARDGSCADGATRVLLDGPDRTPAVP